MLKLESKFEQPVIIAVGQTSAGKSSTLERVVGMQLFPVGRDQKTNMPIKLVLTHDPNGDQNTVTVQYDYSGCGMLRGMLRGCVDYAPELPPDHPLYGRKEVKASLKRANELIDDLMTRTKQFDVQRRGQTVKQNHVTEQPVTVRIRSPCVPSMVIYDLPGMESVSAGKTEADINQNNKRIISTKYLDKTKLFPQSIVLMVRSAHADTQTAEKCDTNSIREFQREYDTIGVISKCNQYIADRMEDLAELLEDTDSQVGVVPVAARGGFVGLHGRSSSMRPELDVADELEIETNWFTRHTSVSRNHWGIKTLIDGINSMMEEPIMYVWGPAAVGQICKIYIAEEEKGLTFGVNPKELTIADLTRASGQAFMERILATSHSDTVAAAMKIEATILERCPVSAHEPYSALPSATFFGTQIEVGPSDKRDIDIACIIRTVHDYAKDYVVNALQEELLVLKAALVADDISDCPTRQDKAKRCLRMLRFEAYHDAVVSAVAHEAGIITTSSFQILDLSGPALSAVADIKNILINQIWKVSGNFKLADGLAIRDASKIITSDVTQSIIQRTHSVFMEAFRNATLPTNESGHSDALVAESASWAEKRKALATNLSKIRKMAKRIMDLIVSDTEVLSHLNADSTFLEWCHDSQGEFAMKREEMSLKREKNWRKRHIH